MKTLPQINGLNRETLVHLLNLQNTDASEAVKNNINLLKEETTYAVVTGQQLGLLGGPLYTFYKMLNTVQMCQTLSQFHPDKQFVPVFWLEGEDADFEEVSVVTVLENNQLVKKSYNDSQVGGIGTRILEDSINDLLNDSCFSSGQQWSDAFYNFVKPVLDAYGIIAFHSNRDDVREAVLPFWNTVLNSHAEIKEAILSESEKRAQSGKKIQVPVAANETFIFHHSNEGRIKIKNLEDVSTDLRLSPNVLLRPLMQDWIFPTAMYVAGAAEISYQSQIKQVYRFFNRTAPLLFERSHVTLITPKLNRLLSKYFLTENISYDEFLEFKKHAFDSEKTRKADRLLSEIEEANEHFYAELQMLKFADNQSVEKIIEGSKAKQLKGYEQVIGRVKSMLKKQDEEKINHFQYIEAVLFPYGKPQERVFTTSQFGNQLELAELFFKSVKIDEPRWQFIEI